MLTLCGVAFAQVIEIYARHLSSPNSVPIGALNYNREDKSATFTPQEVSFEPGAYCISTSDSDCLTLTKIEESSTILENKQFAIQLDAAGEVLHITLTNSNLKGVLVRPATSGPVPNLDPVSAQKQVKAPQKKVITKIVEDENGNQIEEQVEVDEEVEDTRSFVQKYWMYIITGLFLLLALFSGEEEAEAAK